MGEAMYPDQNETFQAQQEQLARRRAIAKQLVQQGMSGDIGSGYQGGKVFIVGNPLGNVASSIGGALMDRMADRDQTDLSARQRQAEQDLLTSIPQAPGPERQQAQLRALSQMPSLRDTIKAQMGFDEADAARIEKGEQAAADRVAKADEAEANRIERGEQLAQDRVSRQELRQTPTIHISNSGGGGQGKAPSGYRWNEDGSLSPVPGGPADKQPGAKPLTAKQLETQRGFMDLASSLDTYDNALNTYDFRGKSAMDPAARAALEGAYTDLQMKLKTLYELGAPQAGDLKLLEQSLSNPVSAFGTVKGAAFGSEPHRAKVAQIRNLLTNSQANFEKQFGKTTPEAAKPVPAPTVVRTGTRNGVRVQQMSDGSIREVR